MDTVILNRVEFTDGRQSVTYLIKSGVEVRAAQVIIGAGVDATAYGTANATALFTGGGDPRATVSPLALFNAVQQRPFVPLHLKAIFLAFNQIAIGGEMAEVIAQARTAYAEDATLLAQVNGFAATWSAATQQQKDTLSAMAVLSIGTLIASQTGS